MQIDPPDVTALRIDTNVPTPQDKPDGASTVTPSPTNDSAPSAKPSNNKPKAKANRPKRLVLDSKILTSIRSDVFDASIFKGKEVYSREDMDSFDRAYQQQLLFNFAQTRASKKQQKQQTNDRASRSSSLDDLDYNNEAFNVESNNFQELSRYILEDLLKCSVGDKFLLCLPVNSGDVHNIPLKEIARAQTQNNVGGDTCRISGREYYCLKVAIDYAPNHDLIRLGMSEAQFKTLFNNKSGGFCVNFLETDTKLTFKWFDIINYPRDIMFFGRPFSMNRKLDYLFQQKYNLQYIHHVFRHLSNQFYGDSKASSLLYASYQKKRAIVFEKCMNEAMAREIGIYDRQSFNTPRAKALVNLLLKILKTMMQSHLHKME